MGNPALSGLHIREVSAIQVLMYSSIGKLIWGLSVIKRLLAIQGCPFRGIPLHEEIDMTTSYSHFRFNNLW